MAGLEMTDGSDPPGRRARSSPHPLVPGLTSAFLLWFAFPPADYGHLAWIALVPLFLLVASDRPRRGLYLGAWGGGLAFWLLAMEWVRRCDPSAWVAWLALAGFLSLWWPIFLGLARVAVRRLRLPLTLAGPILWVGLEYVRAHVFTGLPWYYLAHTQHRALPVIQVADLAGAWGVSLLVAAVNGAIADGLTLPLFRPSPSGPRIAPGQVARGLAVASFLIATLLYGAFRLGTAQFRAGPKLALLQTNFPQSRVDQRTTEEILGEVAPLVLDGLKARPDLMAWPESSYPRGYPTVDPALDSRSFDRQIKSIHPNGTIAFWREKADHIRAELHAIVDRSGVAMLVGTTRFAFRPSGLERYNAAILFTPGRATVESYDKMHLVPFGEFIPLVDALPFLARLTPYEPEAMPTLTFGAGPSVFKVGKYRYATVICFEDTVPHVVRRSFAGPPPDVLLNISNDGWFAGSAEAAVHLAIGVFRAVENRVPLARSANTGGTAVIDGNGRVRPGEVGDGKKEVLIETVPLDDRVALYSSWGDWLALTCLAVTIGLPILALGTRPRRGAGVRSDVAGERPHAV